MRFYDKILSREQKTKFIQWMATLPATRNLQDPEGASYRFQWVITPTSQGDTIVVIDLITNASLDLTEKVQN